MAHSQTPTPATRHQHHIEDLSPASSNMPPKRTVLRKVGGGYIFIHRLVQDYFTSFDQLGGTS